MSWIRAMTADGQIKTFSVDKFPRRGITSARIIEIDGAILARCTKSGRLYGTGRFPTGSAYYVGWSWAWMPRVAAALQYLGLITKADYEATMQAHKAEYEQRQREIAENIFRKQAADLGIDPKKVEALIKPAAKKRARKTKGGDSL